MTLSDAGDGEVEARVRDGRLEIQASLAKLVGSQPERTWPHQRAKQYPHWLLSINPKVDLVVGPLRAVATVITIQHL